MKSIEVRYYALLREQAKTNQERLDVTANTYRELYEFLRSKYDFSLPVEMIQVAENDEFVPMDQPVRDGVRIVFIPPVAGG